MLGGAHWVAPSLSPVHIRAATHAQHLLYAECCEECRGPQNFRNSSWRGEGKGRGQEESRAGQYLRGVGRSWKFREESSWGQQGLEGF